MFKWSRNNAIPDIPDSVYTAKILDIQEVESSNGNPMWHFTFALKELPNAKLFFFQVIDGNFDKKTTDFMTQKIIEMGICFNVPDNSSNINDWIGKIGFIKTSHTETESGAVYINIKKFFSPEKGRAELFKAMQAKQAEDFFSNNSSNPPDFNIINNSFNQMPAQQSDNDSIDF